MRSVLPLLLLAGCLRSPSTEPPGPTPGPEAVPSDALPSTNRQAGEALDLTIPVLDGAPTRLETLRGKVVLVEITATWVEGFGANDAAYLDLLASRPEDAHVVVVAIDPQRGALDARWSSVPPAGLWRAWDPQGALAAQLQAAKVPTIIVLDRTGVIVRVWGGYRPEQWGEVVAAVNDALP